MKEKQSALIIDDDAEISNLLGMVLSLVGYECDIANSAKDGLARLATYTPNLVMLDLQLESSLSGKDILYQIRGNPRLKNTLVIVVTGYPSLAESIVQLADYTITKPINTDNLESILSGLKTGQLVPRQDYFCDPVTGLYNAEFFLTRLQHAAERAKRRTEFIFAVCLIQVSVKPMSGNEPVDQPVYNSVLSDATQSLVHSLRPTDTVARLSNSKLATLHEELRSPDDMKVIVRRIQTILMPPFTINGQKYLLTAKIGTASNREDYHRVDELVVIAEHNLETHDLSS